MKRKERKLEEEVNVELKDPTLQNAKLLGLRRDE